MTGADKNYRGGVQTRNSSIELLRIIAMLFIVAGHFVSQNDVLNNVSGFNLIFAYLFGSGSRIATNIFFIISAYFCTNRTLKVNKIIKTYITFWSLNFIFSIIGFAMGYEVTIKGIARAILPFTTSNLWFMTVYLEFLILSPFVVKMIDGLDKKAHGILSAVLFVVSICVPTIKSFDDCLLSGLFYSLSLISIMSFYRRYYETKFKSKPFCLLILGVVGYALLVGAKYFCSDGCEILYKISSQMLGDYKSLPNFIISFMIFAGISNIEIKNNRIINTIADAAIAVYIIHQTTAFSPIMWNQILYVEKWIGTDWFIVGYMGSCIFIYVVCMAVFYLIKPAVSYISNFIMNNSNFAHRF